METIKKNILDMYEMRPKQWIRITLSIIVSLLIIIPSMTTLEYRGLLPNGLNITKNILTGLVTPSMEMIMDLSNKGLLYLLTETCAIAFLGTVLGLVIAVPLAFLASRNITNKYVAGFFVIIITIIRTFPAFVYGLMFIRVAGPGAFAGTLTLALTSVGMLSKLFIESIEDLDRGIIEALDVAGCTKFQKIRFGIVPQLLSNLISIVIYRFDINVKNASILGLVGAGGIGAPLMFAMSSYRWHEVGALLLGLIVLVLLIDLLSTKIRGKLANG